MKSAPRIMGIVNVTPDSFSDGGRFYQRDQAVAHAIEMIDAGAELIDIGGESTRPGSLSVSIEEELKRVVPVVEALVRQTSVPISVDTTKPEVMAAVLAVGATVINDISALETPGAIACLREYPAAKVCLMHKQGQPATMQEAPQYLDVMAEVKRYLLERVSACLEGGLSEQQLWIDPGIGFGKTDPNNLTLLADLNKLVETGYPVLIGVSRKSLVGRVLSREVNERLAGSLSLAAIAVFQGAQIIRTHDVSASRDAVAMAYAVRKARLN